MSVSDIWTHCFSHCGFLFVCLLYKSPSPCQQKQTQLLPSSASISKGDPCECSQTSASGRVHSAHAPSRRPLAQGVAQHSPARPLPQPSQSLGPAWVPLGFPLGVWSSLAQGSSRCTPHPAPVSSSKPACPAAGLGAEGSGQHAVHSELQGPAPRHGWLHTSPSTGANLDLRCSHLHWQLSPSPLPEWARIPWKGQARTRSNCREQFTNPQVPAVD